MGTIGAKLTHMIADVVGNISKLSASTAEAAPIEGIGVNLFNWDLGLGGAGRRLRLAAERGSRRTRLVFIPQTPTAISTGARSPSTSGLEDDFLLIALVVITEQGLGLGLG